METVLEADTLAMVRGPGLVDREAAALVKTARLAVEWEAVMTRIVEVQVAA